MRSGVPQKTCDALLQNQEILRLDHPSLRITMFAALNRLCGAPHNRLEVKIMEPAR
jgi:hypothetical protein